MKIETRDYRVLQVKDWLIQIDAWARVETHRAIDAHVMWVLITGEPKHIAHCRLLMLIDGDWHRRDAFMINSHWALHIALPVFANVTVSEVDSKLLYEDYMLDRSHWVRLTG
jgi:hypothetical protein